MPTGSWLNIITSEWFCSFSLFKTHFKGKVRYRNSKKKYCSTSINNEFRLVTMLLIVHCLWCATDWQSIVEKRWMKTGLNAKKVEFLINYILASISRENEMWCILIYLLNNFLWSRFLPLFNNKDTAIRKILNDTR